MRGWGGGGGARGMFLEQLSDSVPVEDVGVNAFSLMLSSSLVRLNDERVVDLKSWISFLSYRGQFLFLSNCITKLMGVLILIIVCSVF